MHQGKKISSFFIKEIKEMYWLTDWKLQRSKWASDMSGSRHENCVIKRLSFSPSLNSTFIHYGYILSRLFAYRNKSGHHLMD